MTLRRGSIVGLLLLLPCSGPCARRRRAARSLSRAARTRRSAQRPECGPHLCGEELRLLPGGEVAALVDLVEVDEVRVARLGPAARRPPDLAGERREADRDRRRRQGLLARGR